MRRAQIQALPAVILTVFCLLAGSFHCLSMGDAALAAASGMSCHMGNDSKVSGSACCSTRNEHRESPSSKVLSGPCCALTGAVSALSLDPEQQPVAIELPAMQVEIAAPAPPALGHFVQTECRSGPPSAPERAPLASRAPPLA